MSTDSLNSTTTRLTPERLVDEIDFTPGTRAAAPSRTSVICRSIVSGVAPS
jgi:hypothetical protein